MLNSPAYLLLLLPIIWLLVIVVRQLMGSSFKSRDASAKYDAVGLNRWQAEKQNALLRMKEDKKILKEQDEMDEHAERHEQLYPAHDSKLEHIKKEFHVGEEKETIYPVRETHAPGKPETHKPEK